MPGVYAQSDAPSPQRRPASPSLIPCCVPQTRRRPHPPNLAPISRARFCPVTVLAAAAAGAPLTAAGSAWQAASRPSDGDAREEHSVGGWWRVGTCAAARRKGMAESLFTKASWAGDEQLPAFVTGPGVWIDLSNGAHVLIILRRSSDENHEARIG